MQIYSKTSNRIDDLSLQNRYSKDFSMNKTYRKSYEASGRDKITLKIAIMTFAFLMMLSLSACASSPVEEVAKAVDIPVKTMTVKSETLSETIDYIGIVNSSKLVNKSFKVEGRVLEVYIEEGESVDSGQALLVLEPTDLDYAKESAQAEYSSAFAQESKARQAYDFAKNHFEDMKALYNNGAISKLDLDQAELNFNVSKLDLESASERVKLAKTALDQRENMQAEAMLYAPFDGQVIKVMVEEGELVNAGYPVLILSDNKKTIYTGVSQEDVQRIEPGMEAKVIINEKENLGVVKTVNSIPDMETRTYEVTIDVEDISSPVGAVGDVKIFVGTRQGIKIPISSILSSSVDYVYVVENNRALKRVIQLEKVIDTHVYVSGLEVGDQLIIEGMKNVKNLSDVNVLSE